VRGRRVSGRVRVAMRPFGRDTRLAMSQENVEIAQSWFDRWNAGDRETFDDKIHPDAKIVTAMFGRYQHGPERVRRWFRKIEEQFDEWTVTADEWYDAGDLVAAVGRVRLHRRGSGATFDAPVGWLFEIRGGKLSRLQTFVDDPRLAVQAVGLQEKLRYH
jgi:ketosteroid isomerase-like protein